MPARPTVNLPQPDGSVAAYALRGAPAPDAAGPPPRTRVAFAAAHVVANPLLASASPGTPLDWEGTLAFRRYLWSRGLAVAEAMDTAQRGMGLDWSTTRELIDASLAEARSCAGRVACGAGTDQLDPDARHDLARITEAYLEQCEFVERRGGQVILMASRALAATASGPGDYEQVYDDVLGALDRPAIVHWLGPAFDPKLEGYWGTSDLKEAAGTLLDVVTAHADRVEGVKVSCLDLGLELSVRRRLPAGVRLLTGDDFNFLDLIEGDGRSHSDALLGIFDAIAPVAARALRALDDGDADAYRDLLGPTVPLSLHLFGDPTRFYKTGITFVAWLNGHQSHFRMLGGLEGARSVLHLCEAFVLADQAGILVDPDLAAHRMRAYLSVVGVA